jgi:hypothetical protein
MYFKSNRISGLAALAVGVGLTATPASAQQATFHLPFVAHWGSTVLEPGDYKLSAPVEWSGTRMIQVDAATIHRFTAGSPRSQFS